MRYHIRNNGPERIIFDAKNRAVNLRPRSTTQFVELSDKTLARLSANDQIELIESQGEPTGQDQPRRKKKSFAGKPSAEGGEAGAGTAVAAAEPVAESPGTLAGDQPAAPHTPPPVDAAARRAEAAAVTIEEGWRNFPPARRRALAGQISGHAVKDSVAADKIIATEEAARKPKETEGAA